MPPGSQDRQGGRETNIKGAMKLNQAALASLNKHQYAQMCRLKLQFFIECAFDICSCLIKKSVRLTTPARKLPAADGFSSSPQPLIVRKVNCDSG